MMARKKNIWIWAAVVILLIIVLSKKTETVDIGKQDSGVSFKVYGKTATGQVIQLQSIADNPRLYSIITAGGSPMEGITEIMLESTITAVDWDESIMGRNLRITSVTSATACENTQVVYDTDNSGTADSTTYAAYPTECDVMAANNPYSANGNIDSLYGSKIPFIINAPDQPIPNSDTQGSGWIPVASMEYGYIEFGLEVVADSQNELGGWDIGDTTTSGSVIINIQPEACNHYWMDGTTLNTCSDTDSFRGMYCMVNTGNGFVELIPFASTCGCCITTDTNYPDCLYAVSGENCIPESCGGTPLDECEYPYTATASIKKCADVGGNAVLLDMCSECRYDLVPATEAECTAAGGSWDSTNGCDQCPLNYYGDFADGCQAQGTESICKIKGRKGKATTTVGMS